MILPPLTTDEINKFDELLKFMKDNRDRYINIHEYCQPKWGNNRQLYFSFATHLKTNGLTYVQDHNGEEYIWGQMISQRGLALDNFKNEYQKQEKQNRQASEDNERDRRLKKMEVVSKPVLFFISIVLFVFNCCQFYTARKTESTITQKQKSLDSLQVIVNLLAKKNINTPSRR